MTSPLSDWVESESGLAVHIWSHFLSENRHPLFRKMLYVPTLALSSLLRATTLPLSSAPARKQGTAMARQLYIPALRRIYDWEAPFAEPLLRIALGAILIPHGMQKLFGAFGGAGLTANAALFERLGFSPGMFWGTLVACTEFFGGILLVIGLFTRFAAAAVVIFM